jgi:hypothetical protein
MRGQMVNTLLGAGKSAPAGTPAKRRGWVSACAFVVVFGLLFLAYLGLSRSYPENSDEANILLMADDMLHGNVLLHNWVTSDVPFITTELPQIAVLVKIFGLRLNTAHIAAAMTYTLVVWLGVLLARGPRRTVSGKTAFARMAVAGGLMLGPQTGAGVFILLLSVGHIGTAVPILVTWLIVDRLGERRWVPAVVAVLLGWALVADPLVKVVAIWPLLLVSLLRLGIYLVRGSGPYLKRLTDRWFDLAMLAAAAAGWGLASLISTYITDHAGYTQNPVPWSLDPSHTWWNHTRVVIDGLLNMFGADFIGQTGLNAVLAVLHLIGVVLVIWGIFAALRRFFSWPGDFVSQILVVSIVANLVAYIPSSMANNTTDLNSREFAVVLPFAAVVAGRQLGPRLADGLLKLNDARRVSAGPRVVLLLPVLAVGLVASLWTLVAGATTTPAPAPYTGLVGFLESHHLTYGLGGYWQASIVTVESGGQVTIRAITADPQTYQGSPTSCDIEPYRWEIKTDWYNPKLNKATFLLMNENPTPSLTDPLGKFNPPGAPLRTFGGYKAHATYYLGDAAYFEGAPNNRATYVVRAYNYNLLTKIPVVLPQAACK